MVRVTDEEESRLSPLKEYIDILPNTSTMMNRLHNQLYETIETSVREERSAPYEKNYDAVTDGVDVVHKKC